MKHIKLWVLSTALLCCMAAQAIDLQSLNGKNTSIEALHKTNMWTLVMIWSLDCVSCEQQKPMINRFHQDHYRSNAQVIGIASDGIELMKSIRRHVSRKPTVFPNYVADSVHFKDDYRAITGEDFIGTPTYLMFDPSGDLVAVHFGAVMRKQLEHIVGPATRLQTPSADLIR